MRSLVPAKTKLVKNSKEKQGEYIPRNEQAGYGAYADEIVFQMIIPENELGIPTGYYLANEVVDLLRKHRFDPKKIHFIADMMEL
jgi:hypothetical protein